MNTYKVIVFVPSESMLAITTYLRQTPHIGILGAYTNCFNYHPITACWKASNEANPYKGEAGEEYECEEYAVSFQCTEKNLPVVLEEIKALHAYEEPCIEVFKLLDVKKG